MPKRLKFDEITRMVLEDVEGTDVSSEMHRPERSAMQNQLRSQHALGSQLFRRSYAPVRVRMPRSPVREIPGRVRGARGKVGRSRGGPWYMLREHSSWCGRKRGRFGPICPIHIRPHDAKFVQESDFLCVYNQESQPNAGYRCGRKVPTKTPLEL